MASKKNENKIDRFFQECEALRDMVFPIGSVSSAEYDRLLKVALRYRKAFRAVFTSKVTADFAEKERIKLPAKSKTVVEYEIDMARECLRDGDWRNAHGVISSLERKYGDIEPVASLRYALTLMRGDPDAD